MQIDTEHLEIVVRNKSALTTSGTSPRSDAAETHAIPLVGRRHSRKSIGLASSFRVTRRESLAIPDTYFSGSFSSSSLANLCTSVVLLND